MDTEQKQKKSKKNRIGTSEAATLLFFAALCDLFSIIPVVNDVLVFLGQGLIALFFFIHGVNIFSKKKVVPYVIASITEAIPAISAFPTFLLETIIIIVITRIEDKKGIKIGVPGASNILAK